MACIGELPTEFWGPHPRFGLREEIELVPVFTSFKQRTFNLVFVQVVRKEKRAARAKLQNLLFFIYLLGLFRLTLIAVAVTVAFVVASRIYRCP